MAEWIRRWTSKSRSSVRDFCQVFNTRNFDLITDLLGRSFALLISYLHRSYIYADGESKVKLGLQTSFFKLQLKQNSNLEYNQLVNFTQHIYISLVFIQTDHVIPPCRNNVFFARFIHQICQPNAQSYDCD